MIRLAFAMVGLLSCHGVAIADVAIISIPLANPKLSVQNVVVLESATPGHDYYLRDYHGDQEYTRLDLVAGGRLKVSAMPARRGGSELYAVSHAIQSRYTCLDELFAAHQRGEIQLASVHFTGDGNTGALNPEREVEVTITIRNGPNGPEFEVTRRVIRSDWTCFVVGLLLSVVSVAIGLRWARRAYRREGKSR